MTNHGKKLLSMLLVILMAISMMPVTALADETASVIMVTDVEGSLNPGDTFTVSANISANPGFSAADFYFSVGEGVEITAVSSTNCLMNNSNGMFMAGVNLDMLTYVASGACITDDGTMFTLNCKVKDDASAGTYAINVDTENSKHNFTGEDANYDTYTINATFTAAEVTVETEPAVTAVTGVTLDKESLEFTLGSETLSDTLTATVAPEDATNKNIVWSTSDTNVASVESGIVTAVGEGTAIITVTTEDGNFTDTCNVTVNPAPVTINADHADMNVSSELVTTGDAVQMKISVENDQNAASEYNSYEFVVSYDSANLTYNGFDCDADENCAVTEKNGKLIVNGYGEIKKVSEDAFVILNFVARNSGDENVTANVYLEEAYRDTSAMAINRDIDEIEIETVSKTITIQPTTKEYKVTFSETVVVNSETVTEKIVKAGESVTFSVIEQTGKDVSVTGATKNADGTYTVIPTEDTTVIITYTDKTYSVNVEGSGKDDVTAAATATHGKEYTFTVDKDETNYNYEVSATVDGKAVTLSGAYTIAADDVIGNVVITVTKTAKQPVTPDPETYTVTVYKNGAQASTASATESQTYTYTVEDGVKLLKVTVGGSEFTAYTLTDSVLTVPGASVTGNIEIYLGQIYTVTLPGADTEDESDDTVNGSAEANYGTDYTFTIVDGYELGEVTIGGQTVTPTLNKDGSYTIPGEQITGAIAITTNAIVYVDSVAVYDYVKFEDAAVIQLVVATAKEDALAEGEILQYNSQNMFWSPKYSGYAYLVIVEKDKELLTPEQAAKLIGADKATATEITYNGNVNMTANDVVDVNDAQLVYDIYKAMYNNFDKVSMEKMLRADMNANSADAAATYGLTVNDVASVMAIVNAK